MSPGGNDVMFVVMVNDRSDSFLHISSTTNPLIYHFLGWPHHYQEPRLVAR